MASREVKLQPGDSLSVSIQSSSGEELVLNLSLTASGRFHVVPTDDAGARAKHETAAFAETPDAAKPTDEASIPGNSADDIGLSVLGLDDQALTPSSPELSALDFDMEMDDSPDEIAPGKAPASSDDLDLAIMELGDDDGLSLDDESSPSMNQSGDDLELEAAELDAAADADAPFELEVMELSATDDETGGELSLERESGKANLDDDQPEPVAADAKEDSTAKDEAESELELTGLDLGEDVDYGAAFDDDAEAENAPVVELEAQADEAFELDALEPEGDALDAESAPAARKTSPGSKPSLERLKRAAKRVKAQTEDANDKLPRWTARARDYVPDYRRDEVVLDSVITEEAAGSRKSKPVPGAASKPAGAKPPLQPGKPAKLVRAPQEEEGAESFDFDDELDLDGGEPEADAALEIDEALEEGAEIALDADEGLDDALDEDSIGDDLLSDDLSDNAEEPLGDEEPEFDADLGEEELVDEDAELSDDDVIGDDIGEDESINDDLLEEDEDLDLSEEDEEIGEDLLEEEEFVADDIDLEAESAEDDIEEEEEEAPPPKKNRDKKPVGKQLADKKKSVALSKPAGKSIKGKGVALPGGKKPAAGKVKLPLRRKGQE